MSSTLDRLEKLAKQHISKKAKPKPPPVAVTDWQKMYKESETKRHSLLNANKKLVANERRYEQLSDFILDSVERLENVGKPPVDDNGRVLVASDALSRHSTTADGNSTDNGSVILDLTEGNPKKYFAVLFRGEKQQVIAYFAAVPDKMTKHNLAKKYHAYFSGSEAEQKAFRVIRSLETGNPLLTPKSGKRIFWVCADAVTNWECTCLEQLARSKRNQTAAATKREVETASQDKIAAARLQELQSLYGNLVETPAVEVETPPAAFTAFDPTRGTEIEFSAARRCARMCTNRGEKWSGFSGRGIPYSKMINHGLSIGFTLEQMSQV